MITRSFQDIQLPMLSIGTMRLPVIDGVYANIDEKQTQDMIDYAMEHGANYFDTAWGYHDGNSETVVGKALQKYPRESFYLTTKFPGYDSANWDKVEEIFEEQLKKTGVEYFDFYLFHNVCEMNIDAYLDDEKYGIYSYLMEQKRNGRIKHLGFSCHGDMPVLKRFVQAYGKDMEFCQLQVNWLDWEFQDARKKVRYCEKNNLPVWVMEPVRGGMLANIPENLASKLTKARPDESTVAWCFRFLQSIPAITTILGGMSDFQQMKANIATMEEDKPLTTEEKKILAEVAQAMTNNSVPCTACRYCTDHCSESLDIPFLISLYNQRILTGAGDFIAPMALAGLPANKQPSACIACKKCEEVCPQKLPISKTMHDFAILMGQIKE